MKNELPSSVIYGVIAAVVVVVVAVGFFLLRGSGPTKNPNPKGREQLRALPPPQAPPAWVLEKMKGNSGNP